MDKPKKTLPERLVAYLEKQMRTNPDYTAVHTEARDLLADLHLERLAAIPDVKELVARVNASADFAAAQAKPPKMPKAGK